MTGYGKKINDINRADLSPHPDGDGSFLIVVPSGQFLAVDSDGNFKFSNNAGPDEKWWKGNKMMTNINTFSGLKYTYIEWWD